MLDGGGDGDGEGGCGLGDGGIGDGDGGRGDGDGEGGVGDGEGGRGEGDGELGGGGLGEVPPQVGTRNDVWVMAGLHCRFVPIAVAMTRMEVFCFVSSVLHSMAPSLV